MVNARGNYRGSLGRFALLLLDISMALTQLFILIVLGIISRHIFPEIGNTDENISEITLYVSVSQPTPGVSSCVLSFLPVSFPIGVWLSL